MRVNVEQTEKQKRQLILDFLRSRKGDEMDAIEAGRKFQERYGIYEDWHEFSYALDQMHTNKEVEITKPGGFVRYIIL